MKYSAELFSLDKKYASELKEKINIFENKINIKKPTSLVIVTSVGFKKNTWSQDFVDSVVTLKDLF